MILKVVKVKRSDRRVLQRNWWLPSWRISRVGEIASKNLEKTAPSHWEKRRISPLKTIKGTLMDSDEQIRDSRSSFLPGRTVWSSVRGNHPIQKYLLTMREYSTVRCWHIKFDEHRLMRAHRTAPVPLACEGKIRKNKLLYYIIIYIYFKKSSAYSYLIILMHFLNLLVRFFLDIS